MNEPETDRNDPLRAIWTIAIFGLLISGWLAYVVTQSYAARLGKEYGSAPDVFDSLNRDAYISSHTWPYHAFVVMLDVLAALALVRAGQFGLVKWLNVLAVVLIAMSTLFHGLAFLIHFFFAL